jgi:hypothetical protein
MPSSPTAAELLLRFPGPVTLYPSRKKWLLVFAGCAAFAVVGYLMIRSNEGKGWLVLIFFGLGALVALAVMLPGRWLTLDGNGFEAKDLFRQRRGRWPDVSGFKAVRIPPSGTEVVVYDDAAQRSGTLAAANAAITGRASWLPDTYGLKADDLALLMERWQRRAVEPG